MACPSNYSPELWAREASGGAVCNEGGCRQDPVQVQDVQEPPHLAGRRQQRQATSGFPGPVSRSDEDADPSGVDEPDSGHVDGKTDVPGADRRRESAPDSWGGGAVYLASEGDCD